MTSMDEKQQEMDETHEEADLANQTLAEKLAEDEQAMYDQSRQQQEEIEEEIRRTQALVSEKEEIVALIAEFDPDRSTEYYQKALELSERYTHMRRIRGDGNCFYRAILVGELERCLKDPEELKRFSALTKSWRQKLLDLGLPELTTGDFCDAFDQLTDGMINGTILPEILFDNLNNDMVANYWVAFVRLMASGYLRENSALYSGFVEGGRSLEQYCQEEIEAMWRECDHLAIVALVNAMRVPIRIEYMDRSQAPNGGWHHDFLIDGETQPKLWFIYRPGHYDILYTKEQSLAAVMK